MTPQEKAKELVQKFFIIRSAKWRAMSVKLALICVDEILEVCKNIMGSQEFTTEYEKKILTHWEEVKNQINLL